MRVELHRVSHRFAGQEWLFRELNHAFVPETVTALTGPSGSGKSTLLGIIAGSITPTEGTVERDGIERVGWVFQNPYGSPRRSAIDHVVLPLLARGRTRGQAEPEAREILERFRLRDLEDRRFRYLSGGEAQRLMLARAVAIAPDLLLVDEPTAQLDQRTAAVVSETLTSLAGAGTIVLVATHDPRARDACDVALDLGA